MSRSVATPCPEAVSWHQIRSDISSEKCFTSACHQSLVAPSQATVASPSAFSYSHATLPCPSPQALNTRPAAPAVHLHPVSRPPAPIHPERLGNRSQPLSCHLVRCTRRHALQPLRHSLYSVVALDMDQTHGQGAVDRDFVPDKSVVCLPVLAAPVDVWAIESIPCFPSPAGVHPRGLWEDGAMSGDSVSMSSRDYSAGRD